MGKKRTGVKSATRDASARRARPSVNIEDLLEKAEEHLENFQFEDAIKACDRALGRDPEHAGALEIKALALLEINNPDAAREALQRAVQAEPDEGSAKYMYLGQLSDGEEAAKLYGKGIELMAAQAQQMGEAGAPAEEMREINADISAAFCSLAELYLTELCEVEEAQSICLDCMEKALQFDPENIQALQTLASVKISMCEPDAAKELMKRSMALWFKPAGEATDKEDVMQDMSNLEVSEDNEGDWEDLPEAELQDPPAYAFRMASAKILMELEEVETAIAVLDGLLQEDDQIMEVWYLLGWAHHLHKDRIAAATALKQAKEMYGKLNCDNPEMLAHINELSQEYPASLAEEEDEEEEDDAKMK